MSFRSWKQIVCVGSIVVSNQGFSLFPPILSTKSLSSFLQKSLYHDQVYITQEAQSIG